MYTPSLRISHLAVLFCAGLVHSLYFFNFTLSDNEISLLASVPPNLHIQPQCRCPPSHPVPLETQCEHPSGSSQIPRVNTNARDVSYINDNNIESWWQSTNGEAPVNITLDLGGLRAVLVVGVQFRSLLPQAMVLYYSTDGVTFTPRQYYSSDCSVFGLTDNGLLRSPTDVNCVTSYSLTQRNRLVQFRILDVGNRPDAGDYELSSDLQMFAQATHIRLALLNWNTDNTLEQYFAISEIFAYGQSCICNGHSEACTDSVCVCEHNTAGANCDQCLPLFNNKPWAPGTPTSANPCEICQCNNHSDSCMYDPASETGVCIGCADNTRGAECESCVDFYFHQPGVSLNDPNTCTVCDCNAEGVTDNGDCGRGDNQDGTDSGRCSCKTFIEGRTCEMCSAGFFNLNGSNIDGCTPCQCNTIGTVGGSTTCDQLTGQCDCKTNVMGRDCSACNDGHYGIENDEGCLPCHEECRECLGPGPTNCLVS